MIKNSYKQTDKGQESKAHWVSLKFEIALYVIWKSIVSFFNTIIFTLVPEADRRVGGRFSRVAYTVFAIVTLEGPRLLLMSRYHAARMDTGTKVGLSAVSGTAIAAIVIATIIVSSQLMAVTVDGKVVGYVENEEQYASLIQKAKDKLSEQVGTENTDVLIQDTNVTLEPVIAPQQSPMTPAEAAPAAPAEDPPSGLLPPAAAEDPEPGAEEVFSVEEEAAEEAPAILPLDDEEALIDELIESLLDGSAIMATVYTITINGEVMATLGSMKEASEVLNKFAETYSLTGSESEWTGKFLDDVTINGVTIDLDQVKVQDPDDVVTFLLAGVSEERTYTALEDDDVVHISEALGLSEEELKALYSEYDFDSVAEGDFFETTLVYPYLRYETAGIETTVEELEFASVEEDDDTLFLGQREVKEEGVNGEREVKRTVTRVNGRAVTSIEINSVTTIEPTPEVVLVGTMIVGSDAYVGPSDGWGGGGNGPLGRPLNGWYLSRSVGGGHSGADMIAPHGAPIFAAEYGTVVYTGYSGGYGNLVTVDHGNGLTTNYAHCDTMNVTVGQTVQRGQQIATVGSTGRSSAFHLHFEVRVGGEVQEPLNWIG